MGEITNIKAEAMRLIQSLSDDCTIEDIQYHLYVLAKLAASEARMKTEGTISHEDAKKRFAKWLAP